MRSRSNAFSMRSVCQELSACCWIALMSRCALARSSRAMRSCSSSAVFSARSFSKPGWRPPSFSAAISMRSSLMVRSATSPACLSWLFSYSRSVSSLPCVDSRASSSLTRVPSISASLICAISWRSRSDTRWLRFSTRLRASASSRVAVADSPCSWVRRACVVEYSFSASATRPFNSSICVRTATSSTWRLSAVTERSLRSALSLARSACFSASACSALRSSSVLAANSSSVARSCSFTAFSRASSEKIVAFFSPSSTFMRLIASVFLPSSASWLVVLFLSCSTLISSRRADIANSARSWSLSAWISAIDSGVAASMRLVVSRTARLCTSGTIIRPNSIETRKPIARYMIGSIMEKPRNCWKIYQATMPWRAGQTPAQWRVNVNPWGLNLQTFRGRLPAKYASERVPGRARRVLEIADIGAEP
ncbi:hypothetical protein ES703_59535 [subsurface metagenome]